MGVDVLGSGVVDIWPQGPMCPMAIDGQRRSREGGASSNPFTVETALGAVSAESPQADLIPPLFRTTTPSGSCLGTPASGQAGLAGDRCARRCKQGIHQGGHQGRRHTTVPASLPCPHLQHPGPDAPFSSTARSQDGAAPNAPRAAFSGHRHLLLTAEDGGPATDFTTQLRKGADGENRPPLMTAGPDPLGKTDGTHPSTRARQMRPCHPQLLSDIALSPTF